MLTNATSFTINGFSFSPTAANDSVSFNDGVTGSVTAATSTTLTVSLTGLRNVGPGALDATVTANGTLIPGGPIQVATVVEVQGDWVVSSLADTNTLGTLRYALANAGSGDTIVFANGLTGTITLTSTLPTITQNLTITGLGSTNTLISGNNLYQVLSVAAGATVTISSLTVENGYSTASPCSGPQKLDSRISYYRLSMKGGRYGSETEVPHSSLQGPGGAGGGAWREDDQRTGRIARRASDADHYLEEAARGQRGGVVPAWRQGLQQRA